MPSNDAVSPIDQYGKREAELLDAGGDLFDLLRRVRPRVAPIRSERCQLRVFDHEVAENIAYNKSCASFLSPVTLLWGHASEANFFWSRNGA